MSSRSSCDDHGGAYDHRSPDHDRAADDDRADHDRAADDDRADHDRAADDNRADDHCAADDDRAYDDARADHDDRAVGSPGRSTRTTPAIKMPGDAAVALTIGIPTYDDFQGVYFTIQALRLYQDLEDTELLVVDNFGCEHTKSFVEDWAKARYVLETDVVGTAATKNAVFREARGEAVLCCDSHVLFALGAIARLRAYHREHPDSHDLLQGPLVYDELQSIATHFAPEWRGQMWGIWSTDPRGVDPEAAPFEIPMQGMGAFSCRREAWPGFNPLFRGFGGEEGYIHEKIRQAGGRCLCLPWLRWLHRFGRPAGIPYPLGVEDKLRNYVIGYLELGLELDPVLEHFLESLPEEQVESLAREALARYRSAPAPAPPARPVETNVEPAQGARAATTAGERRAIVCFVEDSPHLVQQLLALRRSWLHAQTADTDLVAFGPADALARVPDDLVKIEQQPAADDPVWQGYRFINSIACLNGAGAERLDGYSHLLRTHADAFITPAWNRFNPDVLTWGVGHYANDAEIGRRIGAIAERYGLVHRGQTNVGVSWYGPTALVRRVAALTELLTKHLLTEHFATDPGEWPGWYRGVAVMYAAELAVNHCAPSGRRSDLLDASSTSRAPLHAYPHIHCHHTEERFSKHRFMSDRYEGQNTTSLDLDSVRDYCLAMSLRSLADLGERNGARDRRSPVRIFTEIHRSRLWGVESASGPGSTREETAHVREQLQALFHELEIKTVCDAGCGTAEWITLVSGQLEQYLGFDLVEELVLENVARYGGTKHFFQVADITRDVLPRADAILCRDALVHLPFALVRAAIDNFRESRSTYLIATTFPLVAENEEPKLGDWQPLNLTAPPFSFPPPARLLQERHTPGDNPYGSKALGVWRLADLPLPRTRRSGRLRPRREGGAAPLVSCICATYNRSPDYQHLVEEAVESFRRQTYSNKELILLNDCPGQQLVCDVPGVRVFNLPSRFASLGDKWNAGVALAAGELIAPWPDDDISLPWRLSLSVELIGEADYFNPRNYWALDANGLQADHPLGYAHNASMFRRSAFLGAGRYPSISFGEDAALDATLSQRERVVDVNRGARPLERSKWFFIYRWGVSPVHASSRQNEEFYAEIGALPVVEGRFALSPHWRTDYVAATRAFDAHAVRR